MNVAHQLQKIRIFFADNGFVSILEKVTTPFMAFVECYRIPSHEAAHDFAQGCRAGSQEEMEMLC